MYVKVVVTPDAKRESVLEATEGKLKISVKVPAKQNLANRRVIELVAVYYMVRPADVKILSGHRGRNKLLSVG